jgi:hypothetical protein
LKASRPNEIKTGAKDIQAGRKENQTARKEIKAGDKESKIRNYYFAMVYAVSGRMFAPRRQRVAKRRFDPASSKNHSVGF